MRHIYRLLQQCLDQDIWDGLITDNPARAFRYSRSKKVNANILTPTEAEDYLDAARRLGYLPMFLLALTAGLRQKERIALKWSHLDVKERTLVISGSRSMERRELVEYEGGTGTVSLTQEVVERLNMEHARHLRSPFMFMHPVIRRPYSPQIMSRIHNEIIKEVGRIGSYPLCRPLAHLHYARAAKWDGRRRGIADAGSLQRGVQPSTPIRTSPTRCREVRRRRSAASWKRLRPNLNRSRPTRRRRAGVR